MGKVLNSKFFLKKTLKKLKIKRAETVGILAGLLAGLIFLNLLTIQQLLTVKNDNSVYLLNKIIPKKIIENKTTDQVAIFMYHHVQNHEEADNDFQARLSISVSEFENQLKYLNENGFTTLTSQKIIKKHVPEKSVWLTFDDGYKDMYTNVLPLMEKYKTKGTFYIITNKVGMPGYLNWKQIAQLKKAGMEIGCHTKNHYNLTSLSDNFLNEEIITSKQELEKKLKTTIIAFSYPIGKFDEKVKTKVKEVGFKVAVTTQPETANLKKDLIQLPRIRINSGITLKTFERSLAQK